MSKIFPQNTRFSILKLGEKGNFLRQNYNTNKLFKIHKRANEFFKILEGWLPLPAKIRSNETPVPQAHRTIKKEFQMSFEFKNE